MKTSSKILITYLSVISAGIIVFVLYTIYQIKNSSQSYKKNEITDNRSINMNIKGIDQVEIHGNWHVNITQADTFLLEILHLSDDQLNLADIHKQNSILVIKQTDSADISHARIRIKLPIIKGLHLRDNAFVELQSFKQDTLHLNATANSKIKPKHCIFQHLNAMLTASTYVDLRESEVKNANLYLENESRMNISMTNGILTGKITDYSSLKVSGSLDSSNIQISSKAIFEKHKSH